MAEDGSENAGIAAGIENGDDKERIQVRRVGHEKLTYKFEAKRAAGELGAAHAVVGKTSGEFDRGEEFVDEATCAIGADSATQAAISWMSSSAAG